jgi:hypothetical protein
MTASKRGARGRDSDLSTWKNVTLALAATLEMEKESVELDSIIRRYLTE